ERRRAAGRQRTARNARAVRSAGRTCPGAADRGRPVSAGAAGHAASALTGPDYVRARPGNSARRRRARVRGRQRVSARLGAGAVLRAPCVHQLLHRNRTAVLPARRDHALVTTMGRAADPLAFLEALRRKPYAYDFYQALRRLENLHRDKPRLGEALRPADEPVRLGQEPSLSFAPAPLSAFEPARDGQPARLQVRFFGLLGPNGPLPLHLTEYARDRLRNLGDASLLHFLDLLHHRFLVLFYRAWAQAQPTVGLDRAQDDRFSRYVGSLLGLGLPALRGRDRVHDFAKCFRAQWLVRQVRNADGLCAILCSYFRVETRIEQFVGHWLRLPRAQRSRLAVPGGTTLGRGAVIGQQVWDRQHKFRIH